MLSRIKQIMKKELYARAAYLRHRIEEWDKQMQTLEDARKRVINTKKKEDAEALVALIMELVKTEEGNSVITYLTEFVVRDLKHVREDYEKMFEEL